MSKTGVLLINLGTPDNCDVGSVRKYLNQFLSDPRVIDLPWIVRKVLLHAVILPFRSPQSAKAYQAIWDKEKGSPLLYHSQALASSLQDSLGDNYVVALGMRYGNPSIQSAITTLEKASCQQIVAIPLFPQYSNAATGSAIDALMKSHPKQGKAALTVIEKFHNNEAYLSAYSEFLSQALTAFHESHVIFSYHSLPQRQIVKSKQACKPACFKNAPCPQMNSQIAGCYRAQCYETSRQLAKRCELADENYTVVFQSRLGKTVWIGPELGQTLASLINKGIKDIAIVSPSFVADCLETLEEIGIRARESWHALGGRHFNLIPSLNAQPLWVNAVSAMVNQAVF